MKRLSVIILLLSLVGALPLAAQQQQQRDRKQFLEDVKEYKHNFIERQLLLTREQKDRFFDVYDRMNDELQQVNTETRDLERRIQESTEPVSDTEYEAATRAILELKGKECEIEKRYYEEMGNIISKKQLFGLKKAERDFNMQLARHHNRIKSDRSRTERTERQERPDKK